MSWIAKLGNRGPAVQRIRAALRLGDSPVFDTELCEAVKQFQAAAKLKVDGVVGPATRRALGARLPAATTPAQRVRWAEEFDGAECHYALGAGGKTPASFPWELRDGRRVCECAAWVAFACGRAKSGERDGSRWWETTNVVTDANKNQRLVRPCKPAPGASLVRPDRRLNGQTKQGHMGLVVSVELDAAGAVTALRMADCTSAKRYAGRAIGIRDGMGLLRSGANFVCFVGDDLP